MTQATLYSVPTVGPASPTVMAQRIDDNFDAIISGHSGSARPAYAVAGMIWEDTSVAGETRLWFYDGSQDILVAVVDTANDRVELAPQPLVDVASAATTDIGAVKSRNIRVTGSVTITSFGTIRAGTTKTVYFAAALAVTYNATSLITPTGASLAVSAGDSIDLVSLGSGNWRVLRVVTAKKPGWNLLGETVVSSAVGSVDFPDILTSEYDDYAIIAENVAPSTAAILSMRMALSGTSWITSVYRYSHVGTSGSSPSASFSNSAAAFQLAIASSVASIAMNSWSLMLHRTANGRTLEGAYTVIDSVSDTRTGTVGGQLAQQANSIQFLMSSGNISSGTFRIYGIRRA